MFGRVRDWLEDRKLARLPVTRAQWENAIAGWPVAAR
ncbi:MAG TPA: Zn-dependent hydrolase, partial [Alcanivorax sp.]|nr:Zn-dependent hydrolase [Alcanivorax sp.]HAV67443.1 Zn-dependent hydrolase [Alcanivorax sp.]HBP75789.1 Zn-dependent hydrolase [Alcanivorax sp.]HCI10573.1 Zn-dependent hydrolase [Alcanivorax sp.]HCJ65080.1 Zn-dependent hydrolase [Alcanivorax sp.]